MLDLKTFRAEEDQVLNSYAWVDRPKGVVRIPIAQAIDLIVQRGLPSRSQSGVQSAAADVSVPTESGEAWPEPEGEVKHPGHVAHAL